MRLIDADAYQFTGDLIDEPTIDAVPVVRCKDCIKGKAGSKWYMCCLWATGVPGDGFCFRGERKGNTNGDETPFQQFNTERGDQE